MNKSSVNCASFSIDPPEKWHFDQNIPDTFESHIEKSVPFFSTCHELVVNLGHYFIFKDAQVVELGTSTGHLAHQLAVQYQAQNAQVLGIDISEKMIEFAQNSYPHPNLTFVHDDITTRDFPATDLFVSFYTLQFIHPQFRAPLVAKIYQQLHLGGGFILFEKTRAKDARFQDINTDLYTDFKLKNNFSIDEVHQKKKQLVGVLEPFTNDENMALLEGAGFSKIMPIFQYLCFQGYLAIK